MCMIVEGGEVSSVAEIFIQNIKPPRAQRLLSCTCQPMSNSESFIYALWTAPDGYQRTRLVKNTRTGRGIIIKVTLGGWFHLLNVTSRTLCLYGLHFNE